MTIFIIKLLEVEKLIHIFALRIAFQTYIYGLMAEWLGRGLQNLVQRFESASDLTKTALEITLTLFLFYFLWYLLRDREQKSRVKYSYALHFTHNFGQFTLHFWAFNPLMHRISKKITTFVIAKVGSRRKSLLFGYDLCLVKRY